LYHSGGKKNRFDRRLSTEYISELLMIKSESSMSNSRSVLRPEVLKQISDIGRADILVGIPSFRNAGTISHVVKTVSQGLSRYFPNLRAVIVNSDGGSEDDTQQVVRQVPVDEGIEKIVTAYQGPSGKGSAFHTIFEIADRLKVKICIVVDSDLRSITPEWVRLLGDPVYRHNFGFVTPYYYRYKYDGTITNSIAYPLTRALYGQVIRQPIGGEFAMSGSLAKILSHEDVWETDIARFGIDIWMTTTAICQGFRVCQASMGVKLHDQKDPGSDLAPMFRQVVGTAFSLMDKYHVKWEAVKGSQPVDLFGDCPPREPEPIAVNLARLLEQFHQGVKEHRRTLSAVLSADSLVQLESVVTSAEKQVFSFPDDLWARIIYDHAVAYNSDLGVSHTDVISALMGLYFGRTAGFVLSTEVMGATEAEDAVIQTAESFEANKPYLVERWAAVSRAAEAARIA
jgi:glucosylglycerate synthase